MAKKAFVYDGTNWVDLASSISTPLPSGMISPFAGSTAPTGWLLSDGSAVSRTTYADLFTAIGTTYGVGDNSTTFNLPDLRGRVPAALDNMGGTDAGRLSLANTLGTTAGTQTHTLTTAEMPVHTHTQDSHNHEITYNNSTVSGGLSGGNSSGSFVNWYLGNSAFSADPGNRIKIASATATNQNAGSGGAHNNMQPTILMNYIIKT
jgi:microcystin-dependent protein